MERVPRAVPGSWPPACGVALFALVCLGGLGPAACQEVAPAKQEPSLRFKNGAFKVVQLTDMHLGESEASNTATYQVRPHPALLHPYASARILAVGSPARAAAALLCQRV